MEIHNILKQHLDRSETYSALPRSVKLAYIEIDLHEKKKKQHLEKIKEYEKKQKTLSILEKKQELKKDYTKINCKANNRYSFNVYYQLLYTWKIEKKITTKELYENFSDENIFVYVYNYVIKNAKINGIDNYELMESFKNFIIDNNLNILKSIFYKGENVYTIDYRKKIRDEKYIIKIKDEYYILFKEEKEHFTNYSITVKKLIPKEYEDITIYYYYAKNDDRIVFNIIKEKYQPKENMQLHIQLIDDFYFVLKEKI